MNEEPQETPIFPMRTVLVAPDRDRPVLVRIWEIEGTSERIYVEQGLN